ncbi:MAG: nucleotide sugar dehydrogenase [Streptosporangiales bacterium]|nr:nucleotide sugar dehydrogenase [Streptosporangiales bacterium]
MAGGAPALGAVPDTAGAVVGIVGLGYVGLPTALALAEAGSTVIGCDVSEARLADIASGAVDLLETDHARLRRQLGGERLRLTGDPAALRAADTVVICVPTPVDEHLTPDLSAVVGACRTVVRHAVPGQLIILTSTTYVGCTRDHLVVPLAGRGMRVGEDVFVAFSPERIDPGVALHAQETTPRVVGGVTPRCRGRAAEALRRVAPYVHAVGSPEAAEMTKLLENSFRAVNIAFANEVAELARELGLDPVEVIDAAATKPYGFMPFYPGPGVGGHCIPCDPHYLLWQLRARRIHPPVLDAAMTAVALRPSRVVERAREVLAEAGVRLSGAKVLVVGVAYKPGVADWRESPALAILRGLHDAGAYATFTDAYIPRLTLHGEELTSEPMPAAGDWDLVLVHTRHPGVDHGWIADHPQVLDATYRLTEVSHRRVP